LGAHYLLAVHSFAQIEQILERHLPSVGLLQPILGKLSVSISARKCPESRPNLTPIQPGGSRPPFFWIHGDASNVFLPGYLGPDQPFYALKHQSRDGRPAMYTEVETIATHYLRQVRTVQTQGSYFLGGYSFGGTVAFEMAQQLRAEGQKVAFLFMIDSFFPGKCVNESPSRTLPAFGQTSLGLRYNVQRHLHNISSLKSQHKLNYLSTRAQNKLHQKISTASKVFKRRLCKIYLAIGRPIPFTFRSEYLLDIYYKAIEKYVPQPYRGQAIYIKSEQRSNEHPAKWSSLILDGLEVDEVANCDHTDVIKEANALMWAEKLKVGLQKAQKSLTTC